MGNFLDREFAWLAHNPREEVRLQALYRMTKRCRS